MARLEKAYSSLFGAESTKGQLYAGFYLLLGGFFAVVAAVLVFMIGDQQGDAIYDWRRAAFVIAALAAPAIFLGISVALPSKGGIRILQGIGTALCLAGVIAFGVAYPLHFNVSDSPNPNQEDFTAPIVGVYVIGAAMILAGTFTSLIGYYLGRATAAAAGAGAGGAGSVVDEYEVPDSVIEKDIEYAMKKYKYSWGEGPGGPTGIQINVKDEFEPGTIVGGRGVARTVTLDAPQVDDATQALRGIRPSKSQEVSGEWTEDTTQALVQFRKQKHVLVEQKAAHRRLSWWHRLLRWLGIRPKEQPAGELPSQKVGK